MSPVQQAEIEYTLTFAELTRGCGCSAEKLMVLVQYGVIEPQGADQRVWRFHPEDLARARCALRLERDLGVNPAGAALAVDLLDELNRARRRLYLLESLLGD
jgi:chaperone modulatory protein CbpM